MKKSWFLSLFYLVILSSKSLYLQSQTFPTFLDFDGSSSFIEIPSNNNLTFSDTDKFTLEAWIKIENAPTSGSSSGNNSSSNRDYILSKKNDWSLYIVNINGSLYLEGRFRRDHHGDWPDVRTTSTLSTNTWYHVALTNSTSDGRLRIYINGSLNNTENWSSGGYGLTSTTNIIGLGASLWNGGDSPTNFFDGQISDIRLWKTERTANEINSNKNQTLSTNSNLKLYYKLNEGVGSSITDSSGNNISGTASGSYSWVAPLTVTLTDTDSDNIVAGANVVTITATFSEAMAVTPTINIIGEVSNVAMTASSTARVWIYPWTVSTTTSGIVTATVSGTDISGNAYAGATSITFTISQTIYFENGTCKCPDATAGDSTTISGTLYTAVSNSTIAGQIAAGNVNLCTTLVTSMIGNGTAADSDRYNFFNNNSFNSDISFWDTSSVTDMSFMFYRASSFDQDIGNWDTSNVTIFRGMFEYALAFNQNIGGWDVSNGVNMQAMLKQTYAFNNGGSDSIKNWDVSNVSDMGGMFRLAILFNQDIGDWNTSSCTTMQSLFDGASAFNKDIGDWDTSNVTHFGNMFENADSFNQDIGRWDTSNVRSWSYMFVNNDGFNNGGSDSIKNWDVNKQGGHFGNMFKNATAFNQDIGNWDMSNSQMNTWVGFFNGATSFNQDLRAWCASNISSEPSDFSTNSGLSIANKPIWGTCAPLVTLTDTDSNNIVTGSNVVTITATFDRSMAATPTINIIGEVSNVVMTASSTARVWIYPWTVSTTTSGIVTATVSGTDISGNAYAGATSITFTIDNTAPTVTLTDTDPNNIVAGSNLVTITATFSEAMAVTPTINITGEVSNVAMTASSTASVWIYPWTVSTTTSGIVSATVAGTDLSGNAFAGTTSVTFTIDNTSPTLISFVELIDETQMFSFGMDSGTSTGGTGAWQQFTPTSSGYISRIILRQRNPTNGGSGINYDGSESVSFPYEMKIYSGVSSTNGSSLIGGTVIGTTRAFIPKNQTSAGNISYVFASPVAINSGTSYYFQIIDYDNSIYSPYADIYINDPDTYPSNDGKAGGSSKDLSFQIKIKSTLNKPVKNGDTVNIVAVFSELLTSSPTLSLSGGVLSNSQFTQSLITPEWLYSYTVSASVNSTTASVLASDPAGNNYSGTDSFTLTIDNIVPTVTLADTDANNIVVGANVVTITATFSEAMASAPTINITGEVSNVAMTASLTADVWIYPWTVSTTTSGIVSATIAGTDLSGNAFAGTTSITFTIDNTAPTVTLTDTDPNNIVAGSNVVTITATFSEAMAVTPTINITGEVSNVAMTASSSASVWIYPWTVSTTTSGIVSATIAGTDLSGKVYAGTDSITFTVDNTIPQMSAPTISSDNLTVSITLSESVYTEIINGVGSNTLLISDFELSLTGNSSLTLSSSSPSSISESGTNYQLAIPFNGFANGTESLTITISNNSIFDTAGNTFNSSQTIGLNNNLLLYYDFSNPNSYNGQTTTSSNLSVTDLSGNNNNGEIRDEADTYYDQFEDAFYFNGDQKRANKGVAISNLNYISGNS
ncbi:BspA family leucine-rich repeat surface protein, partial [Flavobacteriaceae bacterium]|nr:BspA family leucine-rich repeat surface protein [Flavobacteriaceae bacterium]